jgi:predicted transcriptional regulator
VETILVKDMMVPLANYATVSELATLSEAVVALREAQKIFDQDRYRHRAVLVLGGKKNVVGKVSQLDVLRALEPKYRGLGELKELEGLFGLKSDSISQLLSEHGLWKQPLEDICRRAASLRVRDIMYNPTQGEYVEENATLNQAVHQLIVGRHQSLLVTRDMVIVGILRLTDVFHRVSDIMAACASDKDSR